MSEIKFSQLELKKMQGIELTEYEKQLLDYLSKPKSTFKDYENYCIDKGVNPFAPWIEEEHKRVQDILDRKEPHICHS